MGDRLAKYKKKFEEVFNNEVKDVISWYGEVIGLSDSLENSSRMLLCEGMISKIILILRKSVRKYVRSARKGSEKIIRSRSLEMPIQMKSAAKFIAGIELLHSRLQDNEVDLEQPQRNVIADVKEKLVTFLSQAPLEFSQLLGNADLDAIDGLIHDEHYDERMRYIRSKLEELEIRHNSPASLGYKKFLQKFYAEDAKRCLDWFVLNDDTPECVVPVEDFESLYGSSWSDAAALGEDIENVYQPHHRISTDDFDELKSLILNEEEILKAVRSRSNLSAVGCDGICNGLWKIGGSVSATIIRLILNCMLETGLFPEVLKVNKTVMLFKKGDPNDAHSWRPITITPTIYRMLMCHISRSLQTLNSRHRFISHSQKGFMRIPAGAAEHATVVDEMIHDAARNQKSLYITTIDFSDAFGSVPHKLIKKNLCDIGFDACFTKSILNSYKDSYTRIFSNNRRSQSILFRKGVKQGCPLSPTLFNICIEPLLARLNACKEDGYHWLNSATTVQAYADDIIVFSDTEVGMRHLLSIVEHFCRYAGDMKINCKKCHSFTYISHNGSRSVLNDNFTIAGGPIENVSIQGNTTYLGLPIACKSAQRKRNVFRRIEDMTKDVIRITNSALRFAQAVDAIKRFVIPKIDYELMANTAPTNGLDRLDELIRGKLSKMIGAAGIPTAWFYTVKNDGGLYLQKLTDRQKVLTIRLYVSLMESDDRSIREMIKASDEAEIIFRNAAIDLTSPFLHLKVKDNGSLFSRLNRGTSNILARCVKALHDLNVGLLYKDNVFTLNDLLNENTFDVKTSNVVKRIMKILNDRYFSELCKHEMKGHSFVKLKNSPLSSFFMKPNALMADSVVRFAIKGRTNSLMTASLAAHRNPQLSNRCSLCEQIETLNHILNGCKRLRHKFTKRHDEVAKVLVKYLTEKKRVIVHCNQCVRGRCSEHITGDSASLRPDMWWWEGDQLKIAEFTIPYGMLSGEEGESTLTIRRREKIDKYETLVEDCRRQLNCNVSLFVFIVSSLGAIPDDTIYELKKVTNTSKDAFKLAGRMVAAALRESMLLYIDIKIKKSSSRRTSDNDIRTDNDIVTNDDEEDHNIVDNESNCTTFSNDSNEESADDESHSVNTLNDDEWLDLVNSDNGYDSLSSRSVTDSEEIDILGNPGTTPLWNHARGAVPA